MAGNHTDVGDDRHRMYRARIANVSDLRKFWRSRGPDRTIESGCRAVSLHGSVVAARDPVAGRMAASLKICARRGRRGDFSNRMADPLQIAAPYVGVPAELPAIVRWLDFVRGLANDLAKHK